MSLGLRLYKQDRLRKSRQFKAAYAQARRLSGSFLTLFFRPNADTHTRLGLSVSKKRFKLSVDRHRIQRRLREIYRLHKSRFLPGYDIIVSARGFDQDKVSFTQIKQDFLKLAQKAKLFKADD